MNSIPMIRRVSTEMEPKQFARAIETLLFEEALLYEYPSHVYDEAVKHAKDADAEIRRLTELVNEQEITLTYLSF